MAPHLSAGVRGAVSLSWLEPGNGGAVLRVAVAGDSGWSRPRTVTQVIGLPAPGDAAVRAGPCGMYLAHWWAPDTTLGGRLRTAISIDGAWSWTLPGELRDGPSPSSGPALTTFDAFDGVGVVWQRPSGDRAVLSSAVLGGDGGELRPAVIDDATCPCCTVAAVWAGRGTLLTYVRRTSGDDGWDLVVRRERGQGWDTPVPVTRLAGGDGLCPGVRIALAWRRDTLAVTWRDGTGVLHLAWSFDGGAQFGRLHRVADQVRGEPVVTLGDDGALVGWEDIGGLAATRVGWEGMSGPLYRVSGATGEGRSWASLPGQLLAAWEEPGAARLRLARVAPPGVPRPALALSNGQPTGARPTGEFSSLPAPDHATSRLPD